MVITRPPRPARSVFARINSSLSLARSATLPPSAQICRASTKPRPRDPPVISATLFFREKRCVRIRRRTSHGMKSCATASKRTRSMISRLRRLKQIKTVAALCERRRKYRKEKCDAHRASLQIESAVFAIEARNFARRLAINRPLFQIGAFVARDFTLPDTELGFEFPVFPIELQNHQSSSGNLGLAVKLVDLLSM